MLIEIAPNIWVGNSDDEKDAARNKTFDAVLVVAHDMDPTGTWNDGIRYAHVGLVDGPGNRLAMYHAAVLALAALAARGKVLVCCHDGGRSIAVAIMYLYLMGEGPSWDEAVERLPDTCTLEWVHKVHRKAFFMMDWGMLTRVLDQEV